MTTLNSAIFTKLQISGNGEEKKKPISGLPLLFRSSVTVQPSYHGITRLPVRRRWSRSVMSDSLRPHGLLHPWNSPGKNTGVDCHFLLQGIFLTQGSNPGLLHIVGRRFNLWATREANAESLSWFSCLLIPMAFFWCGWIFYRAQIDHFHDSSSMLWL